MRRASALACVVLAALVAASLSAQSFVPPHDLSGPASSGGIWIDRHAIALLPTRGAPWNSLNREAGRECGAPDLSDQNDGTNGCVMAKALAFARTRNVRLGIDVRAALRSIVDAPPYRGRALSLGRELAAYVIAADVIELQRVGPALDGSFRVKIRQLLTTPTRDGPRNLVDCHERRPNNWGNHCGASRAAVAAYLSDRRELGRTAQVFKGYLGDRSSYAGFRYGDLAWQCDPERPVGINPTESTCRHRRRENARCRTAKASRAIARDRPSFGCTVDGHSLDGVYFQTTNES